MYTFGTVAVSQVRNLEVGDLIAREFLGGIISGKITGIAHVANDLTSEQTNYLKAKNIGIPENKWVALGGVGSCLIFGEFVDHLRVAEPDGQFGHMFVNYNVIVAVFPTSRRD